MPILFKETKKICKILELIFLGECNKTTLISDISNHNNPKQHLSSANIINST
jgi:hypothetical protein